MRYIYIILSIIFLFIGGLIYIIYRSLTLQMFVWLKHLGIYPSVISLRNEKCLNLPNWVIYCLPDGLWMLSYLLIMLALWHKRPTRKALIYPMILPCFETSAKLIVQDLLISSYFCTFIVWNNVLLLRVLLT